MTYTSIPIVMEVHGDAAEAYAELYQALDKLPACLAWRTLDPGERASWVQQAPEGDATALSLSEVEEAWLHALTNLIPED